MTDTGGFNVDASGRSFYVPSSFYIYVAPGVLDKDGGNIPSEWYRFMHEYGHLVQDRTSLFGLIEFLHFFDSVQSVVTMLGAAGQDVVLPLRELPDAEKAWLTSIEKLRGATYPRTPWRKGKVWWAFEGHRKEEIPVWYEGELRPIPVAIGVFVDNDSGDAYQHEIGPREIKEAYSVAIQVLHGGPPVDDAEQFEYVVLERIFTRGGPIDERQMIAICHWALQDSVPGVRLFEILELLEASGKLPPAEALYDTLRDAAIARGLPEKINLAEQQLDEVVTNQRKSGEDDHFYKALAWYRDRAVAALRRNLDPERRYPLDRYVGTRATTLSPKQFADMLAEDPIPLVQSGADGAFAFGGATVDSDTVLFIRSLSDLVFELWSSVTAAWGCPISASCGLAVKDESCERTPWTKSLLPRPCAYGAAARYLGLPDKHVIRSKIA